MNLLNKLPIVKRLLANTAMGYGGHSSKLARGISSNRKTAVATTETGCINEK